MTFEQRFKALQTAFTELCVIAEIDMIVEDCDFAMCTDQRGKQFANIAVMKSEVENLRGISAKLKELIND